MTAQTLYESFGLDPRSVRDFVIAAAAQREPLLAWAEAEPIPVTDPDGRYQAGRIKGFHPLVRGVPDWPKHIGLAEARLFWEDGALHVISDGSEGCRFYRYGDARFEDSVHLLENVERDESTVVGLQDLSRFGLDTDAALSPLRDTFRLITYRQGGRILAWRLKPK